jgi:hypothetical protein
MVGRDDRRPAFRPRDAAVLEHRFPGRRQASLAEQPPHRVERQFAERDVDARVRQRVDLRPHVRVTISELRRRRLVAGRGAAHRRQHPRVVHLEAIVGAGGERLIREAVRVQRRHEEVAGPARAVAGKVAAGPIGAVRRRRETDNHDARVGIP